MVKRILFFLTTLIVTLGCNLPYLAMPPASSLPSVRSYRLVTVDPNGTPTPTPFQPASPTPTPANPATSSAQVKPTSSPAATNSSAPATKAPAAPTSTSRPVMGKYPDGQVRILVLGSDARPTGGFRTDIIMLVSINPKHGSVTVLSFPRDLWVNLPGWGANRINTAMVYGGFSLLASTLESEFGVRPTHYVMATFTGFTQIVDSLGGIDVKSSQALTDKCSLPQAVKGYCTVAAGTTHMNGQFALWYVRSRYSTSDFDRERRSQEVLQAMFTKLMSLNALTRIPDLYNVYRKNVETNLSLNDVASLAPLASGLVSDSSKIRRYAITQADVTNWTVPSSGAMVLLPNEAAIRQKIMQAVYTP